MRPLLQVRETKGQFSKSRKAVSVLGRLGNLFKSKAPESVQEPLSGAADYLQALVTADEEDFFPTPAPQPRPKDELWDVEYRLHRGEDFLVLPKPQFRLYRLSQGLALAPWRESEEFSYLDMAGSRMALASPSEVELWDISCLEESEPEWQPRLIARFPYSPRTPRPAAFDPQGKRLLVEGPESLACFDEYGKLCFSLPSGAGWFGFSPDDHILFRRDLGTGVYDSQGQELPPLPVRFGPGPISPDGQWAIDDEKKRLLNLKRRTVVRKLALGTWEKAVFCPRSHWLALVGSGGLARLVNLTNMKTMEVPGYHDLPDGSEPVTAFWDGSRLLAGRADGHQVVWEVGLGLRRLRDFSLTPVHATVGPFVLSSTPQRELQVWRVDGVEHARLKPLGG